MDLDHYRCQKVIPHNTKAYQIPDMEELRHQTITTPVAALDDRILHGITTRTDALTDAPTAQSDAKIQATTDLHDSSAS